MKKFIIVNEEGKNVFNREYNESGVNRIWDMYNGIYEDENGEQRIYIEEVR